MGLDQWAYVAAKAGQSDEYWDQLSLPESERTTSEPRELACWRKHPNLQGWMERLWLEKIRDGRIPAVPDHEYNDMFNGVELELTWEDIDRLNQDILADQLPHTTGFFFGSSGDDHYRKQDLEFCRLARSELFLGLRVFYNSSW